MQNCVKTFSLSNMGEQALNHHAAGKKHITVVTQTQKTDLVTNSFAIKYGATPGTSSSASLGEPSTPLVCDTVVTKKDSGSVATHRNPMTKFALRKEQHKVEILWALKCVMSHFLFKSTDITDMFKAMFPDSAIGQKIKFGPNELCYLICFGIASYFKQHLQVELKET